MTTLPFKAVAVDVDGTFVNDEKQYDHQMFSEILTRLHQHGAHLLLLAAAQLAVWLMTLANLSILLTLLPTMVRSQFAMEKLFVQQAFQKNAS